MAPCAALATLGLAWSRRALAVLLIGRYWGGSITPPPAKVRCVSPSRESKSIDPRKARQSACQFDRPKPRSDHRHGDKTARGGEQAGREGATSRRGEIGFDSAWVWGGSPPPWCCELRSVRGTATVGRRARRGVPLLGAVGLFQATTLPSRGKEELGLEDTAAPRPDFRTLPPSWGGGVAGVSPHRTMRGGEPRVEQRRARPLQGAIGALRCTADRREVGRGVSRSAWASRRGGMSVSASHLRGHWLRVPPPHPPRGTRPPARHHPRGDLPPLDVPFVLLHEALETVFRLGVLSVVFLDSISVAVVPQSITRPLTANRNRRPRYRSGLAEPFREGACRAGEGLGIPQAGPCVLVEACLPLGGTEFLSRFPRRPR